MLAIIARMDNSGLGNQTRNLVRMLKPDKVLVIDMSAYNKMEQHKHWYKDYNATYVKGMPTFAQMRKFLKGVDHLFSCEIFYGAKVIEYCQHQGIRTYLQYNFEFLDNLQNWALPMPDVLVAPSKWNMERVRALVDQKNAEDEMNNYDLVYLPPPLFPEDYHANFVVNLDRKAPRARLLHVVGKPAVNDRNGTNDLYAALKHTPHDFELVIKSQFQLQEENDPRITYDYSSPDDHTKLYEGFDAMILPRRFGGLCLPMNEALMSGLPVVMPHIPPNNDILPDEWLVKAREVGQFMTRTMIKYYESDPVELADKMNYFAKRRAEGKVHARQIASENFSPDGIALGYKELFQ